MLPKLSLLFRTLIHLKPIQAIYQVKNRLFKSGPLSSFQVAFTKIQKLDFFQAPAVNTFLRVNPDQFHFEFLNLSQTYSKSSLDWNDQSHGKLWNYNLQYLDFLKQDDVPIKIKTDILKDIYAWLWAGRLPLEPYPASLRIMNMIRFLNENELDSEDGNLVKTYLIAEINYLSKNLEFHLLANHLLENAFAFWMGALYFNNEAWINKAGKLLESELKEQTLSDGAHYELSPMYHQIILFRVIEAYVLTPAKFGIKNKLKLIAEKMLWWMDQMTFQNGSLPHFNDTTEQISYSSIQLKKFASSAGIFSRKTGLKESGYRIFETGGFKLIADVEGIKPSYQPGHAHADTFSFVLHYDHQPLIVDPGISTYNISSRRDWERSTIAHNTVTIDERNSSQVWAGFRVGKRANVKIQVDEKDHFLGFHTGFGNQLHQREFRILDDEISILDHIKNPILGSKFEARFYFHPMITPEIIDNEVIALTEKIKMRIIGHKQFSIEVYDYCMGFNSLAPSKYLKVIFQSEAISTTIFIQE
ncbi:Heparinase II/III N-terminus [Algoriphagus ornithinivorans]|uniref:Heparinase II/III N-terminus n=1 Tax=Algoriphagus ornithinivorans TaxID=226506 RepID=A0A1I5JMS6_9BACT|nr:alginate lyase family protein [Algoriphagus ornithinivorans]SFO74104.1 Heparinase II/III N-terminus [Algoriphagus ornithinivorans]